MESLVLQMIVLVLIALLAGCYFDGLLVLMPAQKELSATSYIEVEQANTRLGTIRYRILVFATLLAQMVLLIFIHDGRTLLFWLTLASMLMIILATLFITIRLVVPINQRVHTWSVQEPPADWQHTRMLWHRYHMWRTQLVLLAMLLQFAAILLAH